MGDKNISRLTTSEYKMMSLGRRRGVSFLPTSASAQHLAVDDGFFQLAAVGKQLRRNGLGGMAA